MSEINPYMSPSGASSDSLLAHIPGTSAWDRRRDAVDRQHRHEVELDEAIHNSALERLRIVNDGINGRAAIQNAGAIGETALNVASYLGDLADANYRSASPVGQNLILEMVAAISPGVNQVAATHIANLRR